jgi:hypothetical protein
MLNVERFLHPPKKVPPPAPDGREGRLFPPEQSWKTAELVTELGIGGNKIFFRNLSGEPPGLQSNRVITPDFRENRPFPARWGLGAAPSGRNGVSSTRERSATAEDSVFTLSSRFHGD